MTTRKASIHQYWSLKDIVYRLFDCVAIAAGLYVAARWNVAKMDEFYLLAGAAGLTVFLLISEITGLYRNWRGVSLEREVLCTALTWLLTIPALLAASVMTRYAQWVDRTFVVSWASLTLLAMAAGRIALRRGQSYMRAKGFNTKGYVVIGINELGFELARRIAEAPQMGLKLVGFYDDRDDERLPTVPPELGRRIGSIDELVQQARAGAINMIYITFPMRAEERIRRVLKRLSDTTASVYIVPDFFVFQMLHSRWTNIGGLPAVSVFENPFYGIDGLLKRLIDVLVASVLLLLLAVPMLVIAVLVKCSSSGPVFFRQKRYGLDGREILVWKFRTMRVCENGDQVIQAKREDPRTTPIGAILRTTSLDELPQLLNVLEGSMSLVGPRPHASAHNEEYRKLIAGYMLRHKVKPGITGLAQVSGWRGETDTLEKMERRVECDHRYIREWSLWMDIKILLRTLLVVFTRQNAY